MTVALDEMLLPAVGLCIASAGVRAAAASAEIATLRRSRLVSPSFAE
ncbi:MAG: hypothetical protein WD069_08420 [Planctomycetales bacterium]